MFRADERRAGKLLLNGGENLHPLDRIDAEVGVKTHVQIEHLHRIAGLLADHRQQGLGDAVRFGRGAAATCSWRSRRRAAGADNVPRATGAAVVWLPGKARTPRPASAALKESLLCSQAAPERFCRRPPVLRGTGGGACAVSSCIFCRSAACFPGSCAAIRPGHHGISSQLGRNLVPHCRMQSRSCRPSGPWDATGSESRVPLAGGALPAAGHNSPRRAARHGRFFATVAGTGSDNLHPRGQRDSDGRERSVGPAAGQIGNAGAFAVLKLSRASG